MAGVRDVVYQRRRSSGSQEVLLADPLQSEPGAVDEGLALHLARLSDHLEGDGGEGDCVLVEGLQVVVD